MEMDKKDCPQEQPDNNVIFAPVDEIRKIERVIDNLETVQRELLKVANGMKAIIE